MGAQGFHTIHMVYMVELQQVPLLDDHHEAGRDEAEARVVRLDPEAVSAGHRTFYPISRLNVKDTVHGIAFSRRVLQSSHRMCAFRRRGNMHGSSDNNALL